MKDEIDGTMYLPDWDDLSDVLGNIRPKVVLLGGQARVGKTTIAKMMATVVFQSGGVPKLLSFADPIKKELALVGIHKGDPAYRQAAIDLGAALRATNPNYFVERAREEINEFLQKHPDNGYIIIDDCRYLNELMVVPPTDLLCVMLTPELQCNLIEPSAPFRGDCSEALGRVQGAATNDPCLLQGIPIDPGPNQSMEALEATEFDLYIELIHTGDWLAHATTTAEDLADILVALRTRGDGVSNDEPAT